MPYIYGWYDRLFYLDINFFVLLTQRDQMETTAIRIQVAFTSKAFRITVFFRPEHVSSVVVATIIFICVIQRVFNETINHENKKKIHACLRCSYIALFRHKGATKDNTLNGRSYKTQ